jgi:membrane protease YdiL (CAAX protease family)
VALVSCLFNYFLGEELLFRGILLPKMRGVFGKWDWVANSALFALYHLHRPVQMLGFIVGGLAWSMPSRHFRSIWFAIILHGIEGIFLLVGVFAVVSGWAHR